MKKLPSGRKISTCSDCDWYRDTIYTIVLEKGNMYQCTAKGDSVLLVNDMLAKDMVHPKCPLDDADD